MYVNELEKEEMGGVCCAGVKCSEHYVELGRVGTRAHVANDAHNESRIPAISRLRIDAWDGLLTVLCASLFPQQVT